MPGRSCTSIRPEPTHSQEIPSSSRRSAARSSARSCSDAARFPTKRSSLLSNPSCASPTRWMCVEPRSLPLLMRKRSRSSSRWSSSTGST
ncbi:hypothetical protein emb_1c0340 [Coriobacteriaceae bacterium EMTCatB1]|nr:hypothetical protein emb_1c0340 [Coriobacteriaceae bacterium EMTCatB1]